MADEKKAENPAKTDNSKEFVPVPAPELVPVVVLISEAGLGLRYGEIRGFAPNIAADLKAKKMARDLTADEKKTGKAVLPPKE